MALSKALQERLTQFSEEDIERALNLITLPESPSPISRPEDVAAFARAVIGGSNQEQLLLVASDNRGRRIAHRVVSIGAAGWTIVDPVAILQWYLKLPKTPACLYISHNHPSGDPTPSRDDDTVTESVMEACKAVRVGLVDHVVIGEGSSYHSYAASGWDLRRYPEPLYAT